jgi:hypothetical protein
MRSEGFILKLELASIACVSSSHLYFLDITLGVVATFAVGAVAALAMLINNKKHDATATATVEICIV